MYFALVSVASRDWDSLKEGAAGLFQEGCSRLCPGRWKEATDPITLIGALHKPCQAFQRQGCIILMWSINSRPVGTHVQWAQDRGKQAFPSRKRGHLSQHSVLRFCLCGSHIPFTTAKLTAVPGLAGPGPQETAQGSPGRGMSAWPLWRELTCSEVKGKEGVTESSPDRTSVTCPSKWWPRPSSRKQVCDWPVASASSLCLCAPSPRGAGAAPAPVLVPEERSWKGRF